MLYTVEIWGADEDTTFNIELNKTQKETIDKLCKLSEIHSKESWQPIIVINKKEN